MFLKNSISLILVFVFALSPLNANAQYISDGRPIFVEISTDWCFACKMLKPTIEQLKSEYSGRVHFIQLDPSNDESYSKALSIADAYGITGFFNSHRNAFPTVGILCSNASNAERVIVGANPIEEYRKTLDTLSGVGFCALENTSNIADNNNSNDSTVVTEDQARPDSVEFPQISTVRPQETSHSGRPEEIRFWKIGEQIPISEYFKFLQLPECSGGNSTLCSNAISRLQFQTQASNPTPTSPVEKPTTFKPWDPNATRNEKGFNGVNKK